GDGSPVWSRLLRSTGAAEGFPGRLAQMEVAWPRITAPPMATSPEAVFLRLPYLTNTGPALSTRDIANNSSHERRGILAHPARGPFPVRSSRSPTKVPLACVQGRQEPRGGGA